MIGVAARLRVGAALVAAAAIAAGAPGVAAAELAAWSDQLHVIGVVDVSGPRSDGRLVVSGGSRLYLFDRGSGTLTPYAAAPGGYAGGRGDEPYLAVSPGDRVAAAGCSFAPNDVYVVQQQTREVIRIDPAGRAHPFVTVDGVDSLSGIAFDSVGRFGGRLLVIGPSHGATVVVAIDCRARIQHISDVAPVMEGGVAVAPLGFGAFAGALVGADELSGKIVAVRADGSSAEVAASGLPAGGDIGVEGVGFVPAGFSGGGTAYFADRATSGSPHPGSDSLLQLTANELRSAGVRDGDLLAATEAGARTVAVRCTASCQVMEVARGPARAHGEGHLVAIADHPEGAARVGEAPNLGAAVQTQRLLSWVAAAVIGVAVLVLAVLLWRQVRAGRPPGDLGE